MPTPSLILVPARFKTGKLYTPVATTSGGLVLGASGDFNVTRATTATRVNASGLIESVASGIPRLDYFASGGVVGCPALLVEPSAANGILDSADTATNWTLGANLSGTYENVIGVSGNNLTVAVSGSGIGSAAGRLGRAGNNVALASGSTYTFSFLMKKTGSHTIGGYYALITGAASGDLGAGFDVSGSFSSGSIYNTAGTTNRIRRVEQWGTDVYRCSETFTMTASGTLTTLRIAPLSGVTSTSNPAVGLGIAFAAPQIELGAIPTSFIPTTTAAVTRSADVINVSGAVSGCIGQTEGTIYAEVDIRNLGVAATIICLQTASFLSGSVRIQLQTSNQLFVEIRDASGNTRYTNTISSPSLSAGTNKIAVGYSSVASGVVTALNGSIIDTATVTASFGSLGASRVSLGVRESSGTFSLFFNNRIRSAALYTTRLTDSELAALTT
jgi:hypothetical protein